MTIKSAVFPVAGIGTRMLPATKSIPKEMLPVVDKPLIQYAVEEALESGIENLIFVVSENKQSLLEHFQNNKELEEKLKSKGKFELLEKIHKTNLIDKISVVYQSRPLGLGHAILQSKSCLSTNEDFAVILPDDLIYSQTPALKQLIDNKKPNSNIIATQKVGIENAHKFGIVESDEDNKITSLIEKPNNPKSDNAIIGRYILNQSVIEKVPPGIGNEIQLTDMVKQCNVDSYSHCFEGIRFDCGNSKGFVDANNYFNTV